MKLFISFYYLYFSNNITSIRKSKFFHVVFVLTRQTCLSDYLLSWLLSTNDYLRWFNVDWKQKENVFNHVEVLRYKYAQRLSLFAKLFLLIWELSGRVSQGFPFFIEGRIINRTKISFSTYASKYVLLLFFYNEEKTKWHSYCCQRVYCSTPPLISIYTK